MTRLFYLISFLILLAFAGCAGSSELSERETPPFDDYLPYSNQITPEYLRSHLEIFASDSLMGRNTGTEGETMAARYLINEYQRIGISPKGVNGTYLQPFIMNAEQTDSLVYDLFTIQAGDSLSQHKSVVANNSPGEFIRLYGGAAPINSEIIFAGFGINDAERNVNHINPGQMQGKWILLFADYPTVVGGDTLISPQITNNYRINNLFGQVDVAGVLVVSANEDSQFDQAAELDARLIDQPSNMRLKYLDKSPGAQTGFPKSYTQISQDLAAEILDLNSTDELYTLRKEIADNITQFSSEPTGYHLNYTPYSGTTEIQGENVLAYIEGEDPVLKNEVVVLMGHYDHIGLSMPDQSGDMINNGADDNGSGSMALLAIAEALQEAKDDGIGLDRSVLILHVSAEEKGLLGSRYYSDHPIIPIEQTVTAFNTDMIGRSDPENIEAGTTDYFYLIGGEIISSELDSLVSVANSETVQMRIDRKYNDLTDSNQFYRRSDHWNFGRLNVPFVFFFTGVHEDYHRPSDEVEKIEFDKYSRLVRMIYASTVKVANYQGRPQVDNQEFIDITQQLPR